MAFSKLREREWLRVRLWPLAALLLCHVALGTDLDGRNYAVELTASLATDPPEIRISWPGDGNARRYIISRKGRDETHWTQIGTAESSSTGFIDRNVAVGDAYEYQVVKDSSLGITAYGYLYSGINLPLVEDRGKVILVVESSLAKVLQPELLQLEYDLIGDGWHVERVTTDADARPAAVKALIQSIYYRDPANTHSLFLFGHIPVAYSGNIMPDGHENHQGAWPADVYYADMDGLWTDETVNSTSGEQTRQHNVPGDGKFDQDRPPSGIELQTGRVDLSNLTCFENKTPSRSEVDLARQYLNKDHQFRVGNLAIQRRAIIFDRIESKTAEPVAAMAWRNFAPFVGSEVSRIGDLEYFPKVSSGTYLWSAVTAGGSYIASDRVGTSDAFALYDANVVFTTFLGSYYGDWDVESSFLRSALGARGALLTAAYSGQPQWLFHHMALGEPIGFSAKITQANGPDGIYPPHNNGAGEVHVALLGDPTLRAYPLPSVRNLRGEPGADGLVLSWQLPPVENMIGFQIYRAQNPKGPYEKVAATPVAQSSITLPDWQSGDTVMVKAIALTHTPSGSFYNSSVGAYYPDPLANLLGEVPDAPGKLSIAAVSASSIRLGWVGGSGEPLGYFVERKDPGSTAFAQIASIPGDSLSFEDAAVAKPGTYVYRIRAFNQAGTSDYSNEAVGSTYSATAEFVGVDTVTQGNWIGGYGREGFVIPGVLESLPPAVSLTTSNVVLYKTIQVHESRGAQLPGSEWRSANCWVDGTPFALHLNFADNQVHQIALYTASWNRKKPPFDIEVLDAVTGASLDHRVLENIDEGAYVIYNVSHQVYLRITPPSIYNNCEIYGLFIDPAVVTPVIMQPAPGPFAGRTDITLSTASAPARIYYTLDGTEPTTASSLYAGPFHLTTSARVRARAFRDGFLPSQIVEGDYVDTVPDLSGLITEDRQTGGDWIGKFGQEGALLPFTTASLPEFAEISFVNGNSWVWADETSNHGAPLDISQQGVRRARTWYADDSLEIDAGIYDSKPHALSLYFLDFDDASRAEQVQLLGPDGAVRQEFRVDDFGNGRYFTFFVQGQVRLRINRLQGPNAVVAGVFLDAAPPALSWTRPGPLSAPQLAQGWLSFQAPAFAGMHVCIDRSPDLRNWECISTNTATGTNILFNVPTDVFAPMEFFRTHLVP